MSALEGRSGSGVVRRLLAAAIVLIAVHARLDAQSVLRGVVVQDSSNAPLPGATVEIDQLRRVTQSDAHGAFEFRDVPEGRYRIRARMIGYTARAVDLRIGTTDVRSIILQLSPMPVVLDSISVVAAGAEAYNPLARGFDDRRKTQPGHFLGPAELENKEHTDLAGVLRLFHIPIRRTKRTNRPYAAARPGRSMSRNDECPVQVYLDGQMYSNRIDTFDISTVQVRNLAGLEYYEGLSRIPIEFHRGDSQCGVLVLWTRLRKP